MNPFDLKVGQIVFLEPFGNARRNWNGLSIEGKVVKKARKYVYVEFGYQCQIRFVANEAKSVDDDTNSRYVIYATREDFEETMECRKKLEEIRGFFANWWMQPPANDVVKVIYAILEDRGVLQKIVQLSPSNSCK